MTDQFEEIRQMLLEMVSDVAAGVIAFTPKFIGAVLVLLVGWIIARVIQGAVERSIRGGLDSLLERTGIAQALERTAMATSPASIIGRLLFWLIMILFVMAASQIIGLEAVTDAITRILGYIPSVISAALVLAAGIFLARFAGNVVASGAAAADLSYAQGLGAVVRTSIVIMVGVVTVEELGIDTQIIITVITVTVAALAAGVALAFAMGARDIVRGILAGHYLRQSLAAGERVDVDGESGTIESIGPMSTLFSDGDRTWSVPNGKLIDEVIRR